MAWGWPPGGTLATGAPDLLNAVDRGAYKTGSPVCRMLAALGRLRATDTGWRPWPRWAGMGGDDREP